MKDSAIYIHIPFCDHKCIYCDFYSIITSDNTGAFLEAIKKEIKRYSGEYGEGRRFTSIFFGGGTPSLMEPWFLEEIMEALKAEYRIAEDAEITMETNPGTVNRDKLERFRRAGINRISIGIQSFDEEELKFLTRIHDKGTAIKTVYNAAEAGFNNVSIDLIFNLPGQTREKWIENLNTATKLPLTHLSAYSLILERGTILNKMVLDGKVQMQDEDYDAELYEITINHMLSKGFEQYEVSNFAKGGFECRHNNAYWRYRDYLSFGPSAHSFVNGRRWWNYSSLKRYIKEISESGTAAAGEEKINEAQQFEEYVLLALRSSGIDTADFIMKYGGDWLKEKNRYIDELAEHGFMQKNSSRIWFTPKGYALCDEIIRKLLM